MEKRLPVALRAVACFKSAKKGRRDAEDAEDASALAFGETRRIKRTETRRDCWVFLMIACTILHCPPYSVLGESNKATAKR